jgi:hypothetical protein
MVLEYRLNSSLRLKYIFIPLMKLLIVIVIATIVGVIWFEVGRAHLLTLIGFTWAWVFLVHLLPLIIMGIRHVQLSTGSYFSVDTVNHTFLYKEKHISLYFRSTEIDKVIKVVSPPTYDDRVDILGFGYFFYWKIILVDGRTISISCMILDIDNFFGMEISREKQFFPVPPSNRALCASDH